VGIEVFIGIRGYKNGFILLEKYIGRGVKQKDFWAYLSISSEIRCSF
jgi:hypothetical protein